MPKIRTASRLLLLSAFLFSALPSRLGAQTGGIYYETTKAGETSVCAWPSVGLYENPGRASRQLATVVFTEELLHLGKEAFVRSEGRNYVWAQTSAGQKGWISDAYLVRDGGVVVLLDGAQVYEKPATLASALSASFSAGEIAILSDFENNWVYLTSLRKERSGWIEGYDKLSVEQQDIQAASLLARALAVASPEERRTQLTQLANSRSPLSPAMSLVVRKAIQDAYDDTEPSYRPSSPARPAPVKEEELFYPGGEDDIRPANKSFGSGEAFVPYVEREVVDRETGQTYLRITEQGTIQPVASRKGSNIYYAYHKSLPIGSSLLLEVPGGRGYVQLEVVARLRADNPHIVGLGPELIKAVYGETQARQVPYATIQYPKY